MVARSGTYHVKSLLLSGPILLRWDRPFTLPTLYSCAVADYRYLESNMKSQSFDCSGSVPVAVLPLAGAVTQQNMLAASCGMLS